MEIRYTSANNVYAKTFAVKIQQLSIPYEICKYLNNAPELDEMPKLKSMSSFTKFLMLKYDDRYLLDTFGALNSKYKEPKFMHDKDPFLRMDTY